MTRFNKVMEQINFTTDNNFVDRIFMQILCLRVFVAKSKCEVLQHAEVCQKLFYRIFFATLRLSENTMHQNVQTFISLQRPDLQTTGMLLQLPRAIDGRMKVL